MSSAYSAPHPYVDAFGQLAPEDLIVNLEELDLLGQRPIRGGGQQQEEGLEDGFHREYNRQL